MYGAAAPELLQHRVVRRIESLITLFAMVSGGAAVGVAQPDVASAAPQMHVPRQSQARRSPARAPAPRPAARQGATLLFCRWNTARGLPVEHRGRQLAILLLEAAFGGLLGLLPHARWLRYR